MKKDGTNPIMGRITVDGTMAQFSCKQSCAPAIWEAKGGHAKGKTSDFEIFLKTEKHVAHNTVETYVKPVMMLHRAHLITNEGNLPKECHFLSKDVVISNIFRTFATDFQSPLGGF